jgi:hypothetical protein
MLDGSGTPSKQLHRNTAEQDTHNCSKKSAFRARGWKEEIKSICAACNDPKVQFEIITGRS